ncbi:PAS domain S-box protein [Sulfidibacter corallicola]|uniref:PAS domain S-box protein n=1 Tax=Sulfidibacter corallicola TaxID=2818388 RepID=A0A8A4TUC2_SULCO|nr:PAS domain-containing protein [Sulfidibacter corallicola]QTD52632.1 PAS domain S-box protein [Sulfidibacter corallicola]
MVQFNTKDNEILVKIVFYGPGLSGKTTNLQKLHEMMTPNQRTDLFSVNTMEDRTLFFDLLPMDLGYVYGNSIKLQIYTVPGQVHYDSTRRIVLSGVDGVVFVADSDPAKLQENVQSINNLHHNLQANRLNIKEVPLVLQYNKRDLPNAAPVDQLNQKLNFRNVPSFEAVAISGEGVLETFSETVKLTVRYIFEKYQLSKGIKNIDSVIEKLETSLLSNAKQVVGKRSKPQIPDVDNSASTGAEKTGRTVLKYTHNIDQDDEEGKEQLLKKALTSNMDTARLYGDLKKSKEALAKKNEELNQLYKKLEKSNSDNLKIRRFLESLVNFAGEAIITFNELWLIQNWNQAAEELFGYQREAVLNQNINILFPNESMADLNRVLTFVVSGKVVRGFETKLKAQNNEVIPVNITFSPIKNQNNTIVAFTAIVRDLSFMTKMNALLYALQRYEGVVNLLPDVLKTIRQNVPEMPDEVSPVLDEYGRLAQPLTNMTEPTNINQLIETAKSLLEARMAQRHVAWMAQLFPSMPNLLLDRQQITQGLLNLMLNSIESLEDRPSGKLTIGTHFANGEVLVQIIDNGNGMAPEELDRILDPVFDDRKSLPGIRLNATREIIKNNGGTLRIDSAPGKGTKATLRFKAN